jgi:micrococcal nuclease
MARTTERTTRLWVLLLVMGGIIGLPSVQALPPHPPPPLMAEVSRVFDGETIRVLLHSGAVETVRYIGIDAPSPTPSDCFGPEATLYNRDLVINRTVWLELDQLERDGAGRLFAYVYLDPSGLTMVNAILVAQGLARALDTGQASPNVRYASVFAELEGEARAAHRGLWGACPDSSSPGSNQAPRAEFTFSPQNPRPGEIVRFDAADSIDPDGSITQYNWDFGDGSTDTGLTVTHAYTRQGLFVVTLTVIDDRNAAGRTSKTIAVGDVTPPAPLPPVPPPPVSSSGKIVVIESIRYDAEGDDNSNLNGEWIILRANQQMAMRGWTLADEVGDRGVASHVYRFPEDFELRAGQRVTVFTGCGTNTDSALYWCARTQIWDNGEDTAVLKDDRGQVVDRCHYGDPDGSERGKSEFNCETLEYK